MSIIDEEEEIYAKIRERKSLGDEPREEKRFHKYCRWCGKDLGIHFIMMFAPKLCGDCDFAQADYAALTLYKRFHT